ncbi:MAG: class II fructose-bisphosphate aldolase, partial [Candidatus Omnitrophica bacterium]|nr:class II fructose-bisphosphate aldolase [Candidatus Omnitrophota bacterium]
MENTYRFAEEIQRAGQRNGFSNYVLKADHITVKIDDSKAMKSFLEDKSTQREITVLLDTILAANTNVERETIFDRAYTNQAFMSNQNLANIMKAIKRAVDHVKSAVGAGFTIYALDASFIPMPINARATAFMAGFIPGNSSIEAEVGEIGGSKNSTIADALELITGIRYKEVIKEEPVPNDPKKTIQYSELVKDSQGNPIEEYKGKGLLDYGVKPDRIAINNGTAHGNVFDKDGNPVQTQMNLKATAAIAAALVPYGINIVQHGVTGTPLESLPALRAAGITEAHVGTQWQNIFWEELNTLAETDSKVRDLVNRMLNTLIERYGKKYDITPGKIAAAFRLLLKGKPAEEKKFEEMIGKELKNILGNYQEEFDVLPADVKARIAAATKRSALEHFKAFGTVGVGQAVAKQSLRAKRDNYPLRVTSQTAAELTAMGLRGAYQKVLDIVNLTKNPQQQSRELIVVFEQLSQATGQHQKITAILPLLTSRDSSQPLTKEELKKINAAIKDAADGVAKQIFERTAKEQGIILMVRVSEGFGRDAVAESLKANEVIVPDEIRGEIREIQTAIEAGEEFYSSKTTTKAYPIADVIVDVVEGTNQFVTNSGNKTLKDIPAYEAGATSVMVLSYGRQGGVRALGNAPDGYVGQFIANLGQHAEEFNQEKILLQENGKPVFYSLKDPELYAKYPAAIVKYLEFLAKVRGQELSQLQEEIVVMDRSREAALLNELRKLQQVIPGLKIVGKDQKGIADGTVAHGLKASMSKEMYEQTTGQPYGLHKTLITIGGSAEGFMNLAVVGELKSTGAVGALRIYSANMNNDAQGQVMNDQSQRYAFTEEEKKDIKDLRTSYGDAEEILQGKKLFTEQDVKGEVSGTFSFISTNGVFHQEGNRNLSDVGSVSQVLQISKVNGKPKSEIISDVVKLEQAQPELTAVAVASDEPSGVEIGEAISQAVKSEEVQGPALTGRTLYDALKASPSGQKAVTMCTNIRTPLSLDGIMQAAKETGSIAIFQQAISEFGYTWPQGYSPENTYQFAEEVKVAAQRNEFSNYVLKADHITFNISDKELMKEFLADKSAQNEIIALLDAILSAKSNSEREAIFNKALDSKAFMSDKKISAALKALKKAVEHVKSAVGASFTIYALDASFMPMPINARATAFMAGFIPGNSSIEAEVGEIGGTRNSTIADALELITGIRYKEVIKEEPVPNDPKKTIQYSELV